MKLKNLFLASIAVAAMTACSNETEFLDNGNQTSVKDASMQFGIAFPQGADTRAGGDVAGGNGETEIGIDSEHTFVDVTLVIDYANSRNVQTFNFNEFTPLDNNNNKMLYLKKSISVAAGKATISAFVNAPQYLKDALKAKTALNALKVMNNYSETIDDLQKEGGIAEANKFLMSGTDSETQELKKGEINYVTVPVDRVAAKLVEKSQTNAFIIKKPSVAPTTKLDLAITLEEYNFANLMQNTYTLKNSGTIDAGLFNEYVGTPFTKNWDEYKTPKEIIGATKADDLKNITYCTENLTGPITTVLYKAVAKWGDNEVKTFYVDSENIVYLSFEELNKEFNFDTKELNENSSIKDFSDHSIKKYENGVCYYKSNKIGTIARNNVYYLNVSSIADLGTPTPGETPNPSTINLTVAVNPWTINLVDIEL